MCTLENIYLLILFFFSFSLSIGRVVRIISIPKIFTFSNRRTLSLRSECYRFRGATVYRYNTTTTTTAANRLLLVLLYYNVRVCMKYDKSNDRRRVTSG